ncbi:MAG: trigger factor [Anaerolineae bacterium]
MKVSTETLENCEVLMTVEIDEAQKEKLLQKAARRLSKQVKIPGFRPGKAPYKHILNRFGIEELQKEALQELTEGVFRDAIKEADITPFATASLDSIEWDPLVMKVKIPTEPVVELGAYRDITLPAKEVVVTEAEIAAQLERLRNQYITYEPVDRPAQTGDLVSVTISEQEADNGRLLNEDRQTDVMVEDPNPDSAGPDLPGALIGLAAGDTTTLAHTYPDDYDDEIYAGKTVETTLTVDTVKTKEEIELDDELAVLVGDFDTLDELKEKIKRDLTTHKQKLADDELVEDMLTRVVETTVTLKWPKVLEEEELDHALQDQRGQLAKSGYDMDIYLRSLQKTEAEYREEQRGAVQKRLERSLVLDEIAEVENLTVANAEINRQADMMIMLAGGGREATRVFKSPASFRMLADSLLHDKARQRLLAIAKGEADQPDPQQAVAEIETAPPEPAQDGLPKTAEAN